jgi:hypothetical protein
VVNNVARFQCQTPSPPFISMTSEPPCMHRYSYSRPTGIKRLGTSTSKCQRHSTINWKCWEYVYTGSSKKSIERKLVRKYNIQKL